MDRQPVLNGSLVNLRPLEVTDFKALYLVASDPLVWEQHPQPDSFLRSKFEVYFEDAIAQGALAVLDTSTTKIIGTSRYYDYDADSKQVVIGYTFLAREFWGGKFNGELKSLMLNHAFKYVDTVVFYVGLNNIRSKKALIKIGATYSHQTLKTLSNNEKQLRDVFYLLRHC